MDTALAQTFYRRSAPVDAPTRTAPRRRLSFPAVVLAAGVGPLALDTYLPALPEMRTSLGTSASVVQLSVTLYIVGLAVGQLLSGPVSDVVGRRPLLLGGAVAFTALAAVSAVATDARLLLGARLLHGLAAGVGIACGQAVVGDHYGPHAPKKVGTLSSITQLGPVIAPLAGGALLSLGSWRTIFWAMAGLGAVVLLAVTLGIPETLESRQRTADDPEPGSTAQRLAALLRNRAFLSHTAISCLSTAGFFVYIGGSSFVLRAVYRINASQYAHVFTINAATMVAGCLAFRWLVPRTGPSSLRLTGLALAAGCTLGLIPLAVSGRHGHSSLTLAWILLSGVTAGMGLVIPASTSLALQAGRHARGSASALQGGGSFLVGAAVTPLTGFINPQSLLPMALLMAIFMTAALITAATYRQPDS